MSVRTAPDAADQHIDLERRVKDLENMSLGREASRLARSQHPFPIAEHLCMHTMLDPRSFPRGQVSNHLEALELAETSVEIHRCFRKVRERLELNRRLAFHLSRNVSGNFGPMYTTIPGNVPVKSFTGGVGYYKGHQSGGGPQPGTVYWAVYGAWCYPFVLPGYPKIRRLVRNTATVGDSPRTVGGYTFTRYWAPEEGPSEKGILLPEGSIKWLAMVHGDEDILTLSADGGNPYFFGECQGTANFYNRDIIGVSGGSFVYGPWYIDHTEVGYKVDGAVGIDDGGADTVDGILHAGPDPSYAVNHGAIPFLMLTTNTAYEQAASNTVRADGYVYVKDLKAVGPPRPYGSGGGVEYNGIFYPTPAGADPPSTLGGIPPGTPDTFAPATYDDVVAMHFGILSSGVEGLTLAGWYEWALSQVAAGEWLDDAESILGGDGRSADETHITYDTDWQEFAASSASGLPYVNIAGAAGGDGQWMIRNGIVHMRGSVHGVPVFPGAYKPLVDQHFIVHDADGMSRFATINAAFGAVSWGGIQIPICLDGALYHLS